MTRLLTFLGFVWLAGCSSPLPFGAPPTDVCRQCIRDQIRREYFAPNLVFTFNDAAQSSLDDPEHPGQKVDGWLFEVEWDHPPSVGVHVPSASRFLARGDTVVLWAPLRGPFQRWETR
jgi:hypothetical protein